MGNMELTAAVLIGYFLDLLLGDPHFFYHPVRLIGSLVNAVENVLRRLPGGRPAALLCKGCALAAVVCGCTGMISAGVLFLAQKISGTASFCAAALMCYTLFAVKSLRTESGNVYDCLVRGDLPSARKAVSMIVGRDTGRLDGEQVAKAAVETIAENTSDGVIAPLFYMAAGGPVLGYLYKAVNTMDSMVGYKNDRYLYFGRAAARLDDLLNFIPARLSAVFMIAAAFLLGMDARGAVRIFLRDRFNHKSPNSAQTESVCAGALGVQLAGDAYYFGTLVKKPFIGDAKRPAGPEDIRAAQRLLYLTSALAVAAALAVRTAVFAVL